MRNTLQDFRNEISNAEFPPEIKEQLDEILSNAENYDDISAGDKEKLTALINQGIEVAKLMEENHKRAAGYYEVYIEKLSKDSEELSAELVSAEDGLDKAIAA